MRTFLSSAIAAIVVAIPLRSASAQFFDRAQAAIESAERQTDTAPKSAPVVQAGIRRANRRGNALKDRLIGLVAFEAATPAEAAALDMAVNRILSTEIGKELISQLVAEGRRGRVSFAPFPGSSVFSENGRRLLRASGGGTSLFAGEISTELNRDFMRTDAEYRRDYLPAVLAHELLGHGLELARARQAGIENVFAFYEGDEANASIIEWTMEAELGAPLQNPYLQDFIKNPAQYHKTLQAMEPYDAGVFSLDEMEDVRTALRRRLENLAKERAEFQDEIADYKRSCLVIEHFIKAHQMRRQKFQAVSEAIDNFIQTWVPYHSAKLDAIESYVKSMAARFDEKAAADLAVASRQPYLADFEIRLEHRRRRLQTLVKGKGLQNFSPPVSDQITWPDLERLERDDRTKHPDHWQGDRPVVQSLAGLNI